MGTRLEHSVVMEKFAMYSGLNVCGSPKFLSKSLNSQHEGVRK